VLSFSTLPVGFFGPTLDINREKSNIAYDRKNLFEQVSRRIALDAAVIDRREAEFKSSSSSNHSGSNDPRPTAKPSFLSPASWLETATL
jgi:hypothetical protein